MSDWALTIPYHSRSEPVTSIGDAANALPDPEERDIIRALALELVTSTDCRTVGDALDAIESADQATRRHLLDRSRERAGLPSTARAEAVARFEAINRNIGAGSQLRDAAGRIEARCADPHCRSFEADPERGPGAAKLVDCQRWYCEAHRQGHEDDLRPYSGARLSYSPTGAIVDLDEREREAERARNEAKGRARQYELRRAQRRAEAAEALGREQAEREQFRRESPRGMP